MVGSKHPQMLVLPSVIVCPSQGGVQQGQLPPSPHGPTTPTGPTSSFQMPAQATVLFVMGSGTPTHNG